LNKMALITLLAKSVFVLGILNMVFLLLIFLTCRCILKGFGGRLYKYSWYRKLNDYHCLLWWFFFASVLLHSIFAIIVYGNPF